MITRRIVINLVVFAVVSALLVVLGFVDLLGNPFAHHDTVSTVLPSASGLSPNFSVTLEGVDVGSVETVSLVHGGARVTMSLDPGARVPADVQARVVIANALGEQEVELVPAGHADGATLADGARIPAAPDSTPADVGTVVSEATRLLDAIPAAPLNSLLQEAATGLTGQATSLRTIASASRLFSQEFLSYQKQFQSLLANAPPVLDTFTASGTQLQQDLANTVVLAQTLANHAGDLVKLLDDGDSAANAMNSLVVQNRANLGCLVHDLSDTVANLDTAPNLSNLSEALSLNEVFFLEVVANVAPEGPAKALTSGDKARSDQTWLRTRLLLPPAQPAADAYSPPKSLPPVLPGAACETEFGPGVGAVSQPGFTPTGPDARMVAAPASAAQVRGGGPVTPAAAPASARLAPPPGDPALPLVAAAATVVAAGALWRRPAARRRSARALSSSRSTQHANQRGQP